MDYVYRARLEPDPEGGFLVTFPDVPEAITAGSDEAGARANAVEALGLALRGIVGEGRKPPRPNAKAGTPIAVDPNDAMKLALIEAFLASGLSKSELARKLGKAENEARRLLDPDHPSKFVSMQEALGALGRKVAVSVFEDA